MVWGLISESHCLFTLFIHIIPRRFTTSINKIISKNIIPTKISFVGKLSVSKGGFSAPYPYYTACGSPRNMSHKCNGEKLFLAPVTYLEMKKIKARQLGMAIYLIIFKENMQDVSGSEVQVGFAELQKFFIVGVLTSKLTRGSYLLPIF